MSVVSAIGDDYTRRWPERWPNVPLDPPPYSPVEGGTTTNIKVIVPITREEFNALKEEVEALKELLVAAKHFDEATGQPDCEMDEKVELIRRIAGFVGVDLEDVFGK